MHHCHKEEVLDKIAFSGQVISRTERQKMAQEAVTACNNPQCQCRSGFQVLSEEELALAVA